MRKEKINKVFHFIKHKCIYNSKIELFVCLVGEHRAYIFLKLNKIAIKYNQFNIYITDHLPSTAHLNVNVNSPAAFLTQTIILDSTLVKFEIWDTAGQERLGAVMNYHMKITFK